MRRHDVAGYDEMALIFPVIAAIEYPRARGNVGVRGNMVQFKFYIVILHSYN